MKKIIVYFFTALLAVSFYSGCENEGSSDVKRISDENGFYMEYSGLNGTEHCDIALSEGDELRVEYASECGTIDISVGQDKLSPIYVGKDQTDAGFVLTAPENGTYRVTVTGYDAAGYINFGIIKHIGRNNNEQY